MVQALANNNINITNSELVKTQENSPIANFQTLFDKKTASDKPKETVDTETVISEDKTSEDETSENTVSEAETEQVLSGILQIITPAQTEDTQEVEAKVPETSQEDESLAEIPVKITNTNNIDTKTSAVVQTEINKGDKTNKTDDTENGKAIEELVDEDILKELNIESLEAESGNSGSDLLKNQTPQEQGLKIMLQTDTDFAEIKPEIKPAEVQPAQKPVQTQETNPSKIIEQITKQMEGMKSGSKVSMVLNPESLGKVSIQLINTKEGLSAQFTVATQEARNLIMKGLDGLKETLLSHGVNIDNVSVKLNDTQESEYNPDWTEDENQNQGKREQGSQKERKDKEQFEQAMAFAENGEV